MTYTYSIGRNRYDAHPTLRQVETLREFVDDVRAQGRVEGCGGLHLRRLRW